MPLISRHRPVRRFGSERTTGVYGHWPKFAGCPDYDPERPHSLWPEDGWREFVAEQMEVHEGCRWPRRHLSYVGYLRLVTSKNFYTLWYMGNPYRHKVFEKHSTNPFKEN